MINLIINIVSCRCSCSGCPTIFDFTDDKGNNYYFRLRHGYARISNDDTEELLASGEFPKADGICDWEMVVEWANIHGIELKEI